MNGWDLESRLPEADALLIVPPFAGLDRPSLGAHVLQACAKAMGVRVRILYANLLLAAEMGEVDYSSICYAPMNGFLGERFFARAAYGVRVPEDFEREWEEFWESPSQETNVRVELSKYLCLEAKADDWADRLVEAIPWRSFKVVGCTTTFEQTAASVVLLRRIKAKYPEIVTIIGGANCEGELAEGIASLSESIDHIFSGESEVTFPEFMGRLMKGDRPPEHIFQGVPCRELDSIPTPDFSEFYEQYDAFLPDSRISEEDNIWLPYESSRGCWWGQKHHCTFCGINGQGMIFREKSPDRVIEELSHLIASHPTRKVCMVDNIMPYTYWRTLIPRLGTEIPGLHLFYEQKANLTLEQLVALRNAGVAIIQPGIEALSTPLLKRMEKGVSAHQNIDLLRYGRAVGLEVQWNLLYAFPGDTMEDYTRTLELIRLMSHLHPPTGLFHLSLDRFSPYFDNPSRYGITNKRPWKSYASLLPTSADAMKIAYHFIGDYECASKENLDLIRSIDVEVKTWQRRWGSGSTPAPRLEVTPLSSSDYLLLDTRGLPGTLEVQFLDREQASVVLVGRPLSDRAKATWAIERQLVVELDERLVPLATAEPKLLAQFEAAVRATDASRGLSSAAASRSEHDALRMLPP